MNTFPLSRSRLRQELLKLYFTNPEKKFYLRELERIIRFSVANIRRELLRLEKTGLFLTERKGNLAYYFLNPAYPLFAELQALVAKTIGVPATVKTALEKIKGIHVACLYGSFAKNEQNPTSDIDILLVGTISETKLVEVCRKLETQLQREINYALYSRSEYEKKKKNNDPFLHAVLKQPKIVLVGSDDEL